MIPPPAPIFVLSNHIEAVFWSAIGLGFAVAGLRHAGVVRRDCWVAAVTFLLFGCSDWVESMTGAWWRPWWLLVWKGLCIMALLWLLARYGRRRKTGIAPNSSAKSD